MSQQTNTTPQGYSLKHSNILKEVKNEYEESDIGNAKTSCAHLNWPLKKREMITRGNTGKMREGGRVKREEGREKKTQTAVDSPTSSSASETTSRQFSSETRHAGLKE